MSNFDVCSTDIILGKGQNKNCVFLADRTQPHVSEVCRGNRKNSQVQEVHLLLDFWAKTMKQSFGHKIAVSL